VEIFRDAEGENIFFQQLIYLEIFLAVPTVLTAVHEDVELPGVGVEVAVHGHHPLLHAGGCCMQHK
jgi:hypothetical protein